jgi:hypothetical protein
VLEQSVLPVIRVLKKRFPVRLSGIDLLHVLRLLATILVPGFWLRAASIV